RAAVAASKRQDHPTCLETSAVEFDIERARTFRQCLEDGIGESATPEYAFGAIVEPRHDARIEPGAGHQEKRLATDEPAAHGDLWTLAQHICKPPTPPAETHLVAEDIARAERNDPDGKAASGGSRRNRAECAV